MNLWDRMASNLEVSGKKSSGVSQHHASNDDALLYCQPCDRDGFRVPAYGYCQDCAEQLCKSCYKVHLKPAPLRNHVLLDSSKMPQSKHLSHPSTPTDLKENCQLHSGKVIEYFCQDHNVLECSPCITINHRTCKIDYITDASKNYDTNQEYKHLLDTLNTLHTSCKKLAQLAKENKKKIQKNQEAIKEEIRKFRLEIDHILDNWEIEAIGNIDQLLGMESARVYSIDTECSKSIKEIEDLQKELRESHQSRKLNDLFCKAKTTIGTMEDYATALTQMQENNYINNATFKRNSSVERIIRTEKCLGEFIFDRDEASQIKMTLVQTDSASKEKKRDDKQGTQQQDSTDNTKHVASSGPKNVNSRLLLQQPRYKHLAEPARLEQQDSKQPNITYDKVSAIFSGKIDVRVPDDHKYLYCDIQGIAVISRDLLGITDVSNNKVKLVDSVRKKVVSSIEMTAPPFDVAALPCDQLAVTIPTSCIIQVLSTSGGLSKVRQVNIDHFCNGITYSGGHFIVGFPKTVQIMTTEGKVLRTIQLFIYPKYVAVDENNKAVIVTCDAYSKGGITRLNWEGEVTGVYKGSESNGPQGILVLADGSLLVCYRHDATIKLVSPDLTQSKIIFQNEDGHSLPQCVALDREQNKLYVGCRNKNLLLFEMK